MRRMGVTYRILRARFASAIGCTVAVCVALAACASSTPVADASSRPSSAATSSAAVSVRAASNRNRTRREADYLVTLASIPPHAVSLATAPMALSGPALGTPGTSSLIDSAHFWRVQMPYAAALDWIQRHRPAALAASGSSSATGPEASRRRDTHTALPTVMPGLRRNSKYRSVARSRPASRQCVGATHTRGGRDRMPCDRGTRGGREQHRRRPQQFVVAHSCTEFGVNVHVYGSDRKSGDVDRASSIDAVSGGNVS